MVTVTGVKSATNKADEKFNVLELEGQVELIRSSKTGRFYAHARKATITSTLNEMTCRSLIGTKFPGSIKKVECDPYPYKIEETGETVMLTHTYQYIDDSTVEETVFQGEIK